MYAVHTCSSVFMAHTHLYSQTIIIVVSQPCQFQCMSTTDWHEWWITKWRTCINIHYICDSSPLIFCFPFLFSLTKLVIIFPPRAEHKQHRPDCPFLKIKDPYNITVGDILDLEKTATENFIVSNPDVALVSIATCIPRVCNKEEKRVTNTLYALCRMFSESHLPGIQTLTTESTWFTI